MLVAGNANRAVGANGSKPARNGVASVSSLKAASGFHNAKTSTRSALVASRPSSLVMRSTTSTMEPATERVQHATAVHVAPTPNKATVVRDIVFVSSEVAPWSKTGGLADVLSSLPIALAARGHRVMVVSPKYDNYEGAVDTGAHVKILGDDVGFFHKYDKGVDWVFVDHPSYPRPGGLYKDNFGVYGDNQFRFTLLSLAGLEAPLHLDLNGMGKYSQEAVFVANDWHAALVPVYLAAKYRPHGVYSDARSILAIHNLSHQGVHSPYTFEGLALPGEWYGAVEWQYPPHQRLGSYEEEGRCVNHMKGGLACADRILTVSAGYADEIKTYMGGWGLESVIQSREYVLNGIVNGIDTDEWDPSKDPHLPEGCHYNTTNFVEGKKKCKTELQKELGLPVNENIPLIAFIGRLDPQKGADILLEAAPGILQSQDVQLVCLGTGEKGLEDGLRWLEDTYKNKARGWVGFNVPFSHRLTAAADIVLMPSRFEPCGLNQLYAMRYGAVPVAHKTGGLKDTVIDFNPWEKCGTGWTYTNCDAQGLTFSILTALKTLREHPEDFRSIQLRGMNREASWDTAAQQYEQIFTWAKTDGPYCK